MLLYVLINTFFLIKTCLTIYKHVCLDRACLVTYMERVQYINTLYSQRQLQFVK